jgi:hypothetical protein
MFFEPSQALHLHLISEQANQKMPRQMVWERFAMKATPASRKVAFVHTGQPGELLFYIDGF